MLKTSKHSQSYKRKFRPYESRGVTSEQQITECLCPKCGSVHRMKIKWIGRGIPRKFCEKCKSKIQSDVFGFCYEVDTYSINYSDLVD
jgi:transposase-like protein